MGWGKTGPVHSSPTPKCSKLYIYHSFFWIILLFHCILTLMNDLFKRMNLVFKSNIFLVLLHCGVGNDWANPFFPPPPPKSIDISIYRLFFWIMLLFHRICTLINVLFQRENEVFKPNSVSVLLHWGWGKTGRALSFPTPKCSKLFFHQSFFWIILLFHCILSLMNDLFQRMNLVFKPNSLLVLLHCGSVKDWAGSVFPPP